MTDARGRGFANIPCSRCSTGKSSIPNQTNKESSVSFKQAILYIRRKGEGSGSNQSRRQNSLISKKELLTSPLSPGLTVAQTLNMVSTTSVISKLGFAVIFFFPFLKKRCCQKICLKEPLGAFLTHRTILWTFPQR